MRQHAIEGIGQHADFIVADATAAVRLEDPQAVVRLAAPVLAHPLLAPGGYLVIDDLDYRFADRKQNTIHGINTFLELAGESYEEIDRGAQLLLRRRPAA
jgi:hypothetical protein